MVKSEVFAYLAGYLDGDGCITYPQLKTRRSDLWVKVSSGDKETLRLFSRTFGGKVMNCKKHLANSKRRQFYWYRGGGSAQTVIRSLFAVSNSQEESSIVSIETKVRVYSGAFRFTKKRSTYKAASS